MNYQIDSYVKGLAGTSLPARASAVGPSIASQSESTESEPLLVTAKQVAKLMQMSTRSLWRLRSAGEIPEPLRIGRSVRWRLNDVKNWIAAGCLPPKTSKNK